MFFCSDTNEYWGKCIALIDMVAFFASIEQLDYQEFRNKPICIVNSIQSDKTTIIASSYEAREYGIKTGTKLNDALIACPDLIVRKSRPIRYAEISKKIMNQLAHDISPDQEIFSIDETFMDLTGVLKYFGSVMTIANKICESIYNSSRLKCSVGISSGKLTAKYAASIGKGKVTIITPNNVKEVIGNADVSQICGIGKKTTVYLYRRNIIKCSDMRKFPMSTLSSKYGDLGRRLYLTCTEGIDPYPVKRGTDNPKSMGHSKVLPPKTLDKNLVRGVMRRLTERLCHRLRINSIRSDTFNIFFKTSKGHISQKYKTLIPTNTTSDVWGVVIKHFYLWSSEPLYNVGINALNLSNESDINQEDVFLKNLQIKENVLDNTKDEINKKFGNHTLQSATELFTRDSHMTPVISFNYQPTGAKKSI